MLSHFASAFFPSVFAFFRPLFPRFRILSSLFFLSALFPFLLSAAPRCSRGSFVPSVFLPFPSDWFPIQTSRFCLLSLLFVSFRSSLLRSRSRSAGAHLSLSLRCSPWRSLSFVRSRFRLQLLSLCFFRSSLFPASPHSRLFGCSSGPFVPSVFLLPSRLVSHAFLPDSKYLAFCSFPFVLPCFAPTAVPQVLPFWISPPGSVPGFRFLVDRFHVSISLLSILFFLSCFPCLASQLASQVPPFPLSLLRPSPLVPPGFPCVPHDSSVLSFPFVSFRPSQLRSHGCSTGAHLRSPSGVFPGFRFLSSASALGFGYSAFRASFPFIPVFPRWVLSGACLSASLAACFHAVGSALVLGLPAIPFPGLTASRHRRSHSSRPSSFRLPAVPLAFALGSVIGQSDTP